MLRVLTFLCRLLLAAVFAASALYLVVEAIPAQEAAKLQRECPPLTIRPLTEPQLTELRAQMAAATKEGTPRLVFRGVTPELNELLRSVGLSPDLSGYVSLMSEPIDTGDTRLDLLRATIRSSIYPPPCEGSVWVSADGNLAVCYVELGKHIVDIHENSPEGILNTLILLGAPQEEP